MKERTYVCCDLKSFYASVECVERGLDPMTTNLVVADKRRTDKTICLAVSPSLKAYGIAGRARLFEVVQKVAEVNARRKWNAPGHQLTGSSWHDPEVQKNPALALDYIVAPPRMAHYINWSTKIYSVYLSLWRGSGCRRFSYKMPLSSGRCRPGKIRVRPAPCSPA